MPSSKLKTGLLRRSSVCHQGGTALASQNVTSMSRLRALLTTSPTRSPSSPSASPAPPSALDCTTGRGEKYDYEGGL